MQTPEEVNTLPKQFTTRRDDGQNLPCQGFSVSIFGDSGVNIHIKPGHQDDGYDGRLIVDRGVVLVQRSYSSDTNNNAISIRGFARGKDDDHFPELIIPITSIANTLKSTLVSSPSGSTVKGKIVIKTTHSLNTLITMEPMTITIKMRVVNSVAMIQSIDNAMKTWSNKKK